MLTIFLNTLIWCTCSNALLIKWVLVIEVAVMYLSAMMGKPNDKDWIVGKSPQSSFLKIHCSSHVDLEGSEVIVIDTSLVVVKDHYLNVYSQ